MIWFLDSVDFWRDLAILFYALGLVVAGIMSVEPWSELPVADRNLTRWLLYVIRPFLWPLVIAGILTWVAVRSLLISLGALAPRETKDSEEEK